MTRAPLGNPYVPPSVDNHYMTASGPNIYYKGQSMTLYGCTIYLSTQGATASWRTDIRTTILENLILTAYRNGLNLIRITDYWDSSTLGQTYDDPTIWTNIDYIVTRCQQLGIFCMMDISGNKALLTSQGIDPTVASNWTTLINAVGAHYNGTATSICWYNLSGEPSTPTDQTSTDALASFYTTLCNTMHTADNGTHLISSGGLTHMNTVVAGISYPAWWYPIFTIANNNILSIKDYSVNDLAYMSNISSIIGANGSNPINKPISCNEFGAQYEQNIPAFSNTLAASITLGATVTTLTLNTTISQTVLAGTIIALSGTENCVVATTTSSGTSLPVTSFTASAGHSIGDTTIAIGFADVSHSLADTVLNFYKAVLGVNTSILKWNNSSRTVVVTSVLGGQALGISSYVVWNLGFQITNTGYDVSYYTTPDAWAFYRKAALSSAIQMKSADLASQYKKINNDLVSSQLRLLATTYYGNSTNSQEIYGELDGLFSFEAMSQLHSMKSIDDVTAFLQTTAYISSVLNDTPIVFYRLNEASGAATITDYSGRKMTGIISGGVTPGQSGALAYLSDTSMLFDGSSGKITLPAGVRTDNYAALSVAAWIYLPSATFAQTATIIGNSHTGVDQLGFRLTLTPNAAAVRLNVGNGSTNVGPSGAALSANTWYHIVGTYDGANIRIYINGQQSASSAFTGLIATSTFQTGIGYNPSINGDFFPGRIQAVALYNYALTANQILVRYNTGIAP